MRCLSRYWVLLWMMVTSLIVSHNPLHAAENESEPIRFNGGFWGLQVHTGLAIRSQSGQIAPTFALAGRFASLMSLLDVEASIWLSFYSQNAGPDKHERYDVLHTSMFFSGHLHPMFSDHLKGGFGSLFLASIYLGPGIGLELVSLDNKHTSSLTPGFGFNLDLGAAIPLTQVQNEPRSWWLGLDYRYKFVGVETGVTGLQNFDQHMIVLSLQLRFHDINTVHFPRPDEFRQP